MFRRLLHASLIGFTLLASRAAAQSPLRVLELRPGDEIAPGDVLTITFDRPVVVSLEDAIDPARVVRLDPRVPVRIDWRDPSTIRVAPLEPLAPGSRFTLTLDTTFAAADGERLARPHRFAVVVRGPRRLASMPWLAPGGGPPFDPTGALRILYSSPLDSGFLERSIRYTVWAARNCAPETFSYRVVRQRPLEPDDPWDFRHHLTGTRADSFLRLVDLRPERPLPEGCGGELVLPSLDTLDTPETRYRVGTAAPFALITRSLCSGPDCFTALSHVLLFTAAVRRDDFLAHTRFEPPDAFDVATSEHASSAWRIATRFKARTTYRIVVDSALRDVWGRALGKTEVITITTGDDPPALGHAVGLHTLSRAAAPSLRLRHVNVDSIEVLLRPVADEELAKVVLADSTSALSRLWVTADTLRRLVDLDGGANETRITEIPLPELDGQFRNRLVGVQARVRRALARSGDAAPAAPMLSILARGRDARPTSLAFVQHTNLMAHAVVGEREGAVFVTDVRSGAPVSDAEVSLRDAQAVLWARGRTDATGVAVLEPARPALELPSDAERSGPFYRSWQAAEARLVEVSTAGDRVVLPIQSVSVFGATARWNALGSSVAYRAPSVRAAVFTDRDIYRPEEWVYGAAVVREGPLDEMRPIEGPTRARWRIAMFSPLDRNWTTIDTREGWLSRSGTTADSFRIPAGARLGAYRLELALHRAGRWRPVREAGFTVAEYRAPEFLLRLAADSGVRFLGDTGRARLSARFLFDAPMGHAPVDWSVFFEELQPSELEIADLPRGFHVGDQAAWIDWRDSSKPLYVTGSDTLDAAGGFSLSVPTGDMGLSRGARLRYHVAVTDVNRQVVTASATQVMHGSTFYLAVRDGSPSYWWTPGAPQRVEILAVRPDGQRVSGVSVRTALVRWRWGSEDDQGRPTGAWRWMRDTIRIDSVVTADTAVSMKFTVANAGYHAVVVTAQDEARRPMRSSLTRYVLGPRGAGWGDMPTRLPVVLSTEEARAGDTALVAFASPFDSAEVWVTVEQERVLWQRRMSVGAGPVSLSLPVDESFMPHVNVSVWVVNRSDAARFDSLHHRVRRGSVRLSVEAASRRLTVGVRPERPAYAPADSAAVLIDVRDARGRSAPSMLAVWAVDEGVLSLTGYERPDPLEELYRSGGGYLLHRSTLAWLRTGGPDAFLRRLIGFRAVDDAGARGLEEVVIEGTQAHSEAVRLGFTAAPMTTSPLLRQDFRTTAFFRAFVATDGDGHARVAVKLPDNVTTFRVIVIAASAGERLGSGESPLIATKPLLIRAAMPRFVRPGDEFLAGGVANARDARPRPIEVHGEVSGFTRVGRARQRATLGRSGTEVRFRWRVAQTDSARVRLTVSDGALADAVSVSVPVRPAFSPRAHTLSGIVRDSGTVTFVLPPEIDPARSTLTLRVGSSPMPAIEVAGYYLRAYPYYHTECILSVGRWIVAMLRLNALGISNAHDVLELREELQRVVNLLAERQGRDGGFGFWSSATWTSPWLSAQVGHLLLDAKEFGAIVEPGMVNRLAASLTRDLEAARRVPDNPYGTRVERWRTAAARLADRLSSAHFLSRIGSPVAATEAGRLMRESNRMWWEDRVWLAHLLHRTNQPEEARALLARAWAQVTPAGLRVEIPDSLLGTGVFASRIRPPARLLSATLAIEPSHPLLGALVERIVQRSRSQSRWTWNTQDHAWAAVALSEFAAGHRGRASGLVVHSARQRAGRGPLAALPTPDAGIRDTTIDLDGLIEMRGDSAVLPLALTAADGPVYYALTVEEIPRKRPLRPDIRGISVERWYERFDDARPVTELREGELVRVRLRVTVPADREFVAVEDLLPAGLEAVDRSLLTSGTLGPFRTPAADSAQARSDMEARGTSLFGTWIGGWWSPWEHTETRDDRVRYFARILWKGTYNASYVARATTSGRFVRPPAHAEEMYNPALSGRSEGGWFRIVERRDR